MEFNELNVVPTPRPSDSWGLVFTDGPRKGQWVHAARGILLTWAGEKPARDFAVANGLMVVEPEKHVDPVKALEDYWVDKNGGYHPAFTVEKWIGAVKNNCTRDGYWAWVQEQINMSGIAL